MLLTLFIISGIIYLSMQIWISMGWSKISPPLQNAPPPPLSVIIAAHNEYENLKQFLPSVLNQAYDTFEVIVVLDRCTDGSIEILKEFQATHPHLKTIEISAKKPDWSPKKWALTCGIKLAKNDLLVFTDADCEARPDWLQGVGRSFGHSTDFVLGLGDYQRFPGLLNLFIRYETFYTAFQFIGLAVNGFPYMAVGRNLAYRKKVFEENGGFESVKDKLSGDDDLLVNALAKKNRTEVMIDPETRTVSVPKRRIGSWVGQKVRHVSASKGYSASSKWVLSIFHLSHTLHLTLFFIILGLGLINWGILLIYVGRMGASWYIFSIINQKYREKQLLSLYPILELLFFLYNLSMVPWGLIAKPKWKKNLKFQKIPRKTERL